MQPPLRPQGPRGETTEEKDKDPHPAQAVSQPQDCRLGPGSLIAPGPTCGTPLDIPVALGIEDRVNSCSLFMPALYPKE